MLLGHVASSAGILIVVTSEVDLNIEHAETGTRTGGKKSWV